MAAHQPADIRNIILTGHGGCGKTTLAEHLLHKVGATNRIGSVEDGTTITDHTEQEKHHHHSLALGVAHFEHEGKLVNLLDAPGMADFVGLAISGMPAAETTAIVIDAVKGVQTVTRRIMNVANERNLPRIIIINRIDSGEADPEAIVESIRTSFGSACLPINLPASGGTKVVNVFEAESGEETDFSSVEEAHTQIVEQVVEVDEALMEQYLEEGAEGLDKGKVHAAFEQAMREGHLVPICFTSAKQDVGMTDLLHVFSTYCPSPTEGNPRTFIRQDESAEEVFPEPDPAKPVIAHVFKIAADPFVGKLGFFRVHQGTMKAKSEVYINDRKKALRIGSLYKVQGKEQTEVSELGPGEIGAVAKVEEIEFDGVLHGDPKDDLRLNPLPLPKPMFGLSVELTNHKDEAKFGPAVQKLMSEDPCFVVERVVATKQTVARGMGELHLRVILEKLKDQFKIEVETAQPKVAYKETITANAEGHHRHKKQSGGSGEFGEVYLRVAPLPADHEDGFEFENKTVGGAVPKQFMPAIEKGVRQALVDGAIAGYPLLGVRVEVYDGKHHAVDSKEVAFMKAGKRAFIDAVHKAKPALLEPFVELEITVPASFMGDITGDLSTKRGRVIDTDMVGADTCIVRASAPLSELQTYSNELKSMTAGAGSFSMDYSHDERTPPNIQAEVVAAYKPHEDDD
jgi:elongation factor G